MKPAKITSLVITIISGAVSLVIYLTPRILAKIFLGRATADAASIGIIGGADGPTAFFVSRGTPPPRFVFPVIFVISAILWLLLRYKSNNDRISTQEDK
jgi:Na+-transporting methylmalonyl-CoA/oxaloacetate decarboxylase, beta subunit